MPVSHHITMPTGFLSLAPATSSSYPVPPKPRTAAAAASEPAAAVAGEEQQQQQQLPLTTTALAQVAATSASPVALPAEAAKQRTESLSSDGSKSGSGLRYLKLGPVHQGAHLDGAKGDWHDLAVE